MSGGSYCLCPEHSGTSPEEASSCLLRQPADRSTPHCESGRRCLPSSYVTHHHYDAAAKLQHRHKYNQDNLYCQTKLMSSKRTI